MYLSNLATSQSLHFERLGDLTDLENAILHFKVAVKLKRDDHPDKTMHLSNLASSQ